MSGKESALQVEKRIYKRRDGANTFGEMGSVIGKAAHIELLRRSASIAFVYNNTQKTDGSQKRLFIILLQSLSIAFRLFSEMQSNIDSGSERK